MSLVTVLGSSVQTSKHIKVSDLNYQGSNSAHPTCVVLMVFSEQVKEVG